MSDNRETVNIFQKTLERLEAMDEVTVKRRFGIPKARMVELVKDTIIEFENDNVDSTVSG